MGENRVVWQHRTGYCVELQRSPSAAAQERIWVRAANGTTLFMDVADARQLVRDLADAVALAAQARTAKGVRR